MEQRSGHMALRNCTSGFGEYMEVLESADWPQQVEELSDQNEQGFGGGVYISTGQVRGLKPRAAGRLSQGEDFNFAVHFTGFDGFWDGLLCKGFWC